MPDLLFEMGVEEIPALYVRPALDQLRADCEAALKEAGLKHKTVLATGTPRRLVLAVSELPVAQAAREEEVSGPPEAAAYRDGQPTKAALGFARKNGVPVEELYLKETGKGSYVHARLRIEGRPVAEILLELLPALVLGLRWPKSMRWPQAAPAAPRQSADAAGEGKKKKKKKGKGAKAVTFARPVRRLMCILGNQVVPVEVFALRASRMTQGHPFLSGERQIALERADYPAFRALLKGHKVVVDRNERRAVIRKELEDLYERYGASLKHDHLVEEVTDLVELPHVLEGRFDERYLELPPEIVDAAMTEHQRYFPIYNKEGALQPVFAFVADRMARSAALIVEGNERVLRARLEDAMFYLREDEKVPLEERSEGLRGLVFHEKLGTLYERTRRLETLTEAVAGLMRLGDADTKAALRAATLSKTDLTTDLVAEFPRLQGTIGAEYARRAGEPADVTAAIAEHYAPRFATDHLPESAAGTALALAERMDHVACFFAAGLGPTGSTDPYALRRQAIGAVRIVAEKSLDVPIDQLIDAAVANVPAGLMEPAELAATLRSFLGERFAAFLRDRGYRYDVVDAVLAAKPLDDFADVQRRTEAVMALSREPSFPALVELVERTYNISKSLDDPEKGLERRPVNEAHLQVDEEKALWTAWLDVRGQFGALVAEYEHVQASHLYLEALKVPVHAFFDKVFVNTDDADVRLNRLSLVRDLHDAFAKTIANLCKIVMEG